MGALRLMLKTMLARVPDLDQWERDQGYPMLNEPVLAHDSEQWRATAEQQELNLLSPAIEPHNLTMTGRIAG